MSKPWALISDAHIHSWNRFSTVNEDGINSRLCIILDEISRACDVLAKKGGKKVRIAGDLFHVRGQIAPSVLNPTLDRFRALVDAGFEFEAIPGNHDLEGKESDKLGNALGALRDVGMVVHDELHYDDEDHHGRCVMVPWRNSTDKLMDELKGMAGGWSHDFDAIIHAPVNGVLPGIPDHGLNADDLAAIGFRRIFSGHYHNHKVMADGKVISIGATTHQTFSDIGTKAGFLIVDDDDFTFHASHAPRFVEIKDQPEEEWPDLVDGNYVRLKLEDVSESEIVEAREELFKMGAAGVVVNATRSTKTVTRAGATVKSGESVEGSVEAFIKHKGYDRGEELSKLCGSILTEAKEAAE